MGCLVSKRIENLCHLERTPRSYTKRNTVYWEDEIKAKRGRKGLSTLPTWVHEINGVDINSMSASELKQHLKDLGIKTRVRHIKKLRDLLENALNNETDV